MAQTLELEDIQGLVVRGYGGLPTARYLLCAVDSPERARAWLASLAGRLDAAGGRPVGGALNVAFTHAGLAALGVPRSALDGFAREFSGGMTDPHRARMLGDVDESAPERWDWGAPGGEPVHVLVLVFARDDAALRTSVSELEGELGGAGMRVVRALETAELRPTEHFGFRDGISQPRIEGLGPAPAHDSIKAGEFLLGYPNEYGMLPASPGDLGRNGSYLVLRQLAQDVHGFWSFCERATARPDGSADPAARVRLAAKMIGRWPSGAPLALAPDADDARLATATEFGYHAQDPDGLRCPIGAHVRRAHPRDSLDPAPGSQSSIAVDKRHRLLRRGREYGPYVPAEDLLSPGVDDAWRDEPRGLHFICLGASIARQFEFVQHTWVANPRFAGLYDGPDPLMAPEPAGGRTFTVPARPVRERYTGLPRFVTVRGGAYFFLPGIRAVRSLATLS